MPPGVHDRHREHTIGVVRVDPHRPALGELDGVREQVQENLADPGGVAPHAVGQRPNVGLERQPGALRKVFDHAHRGANLLARMHRDVLDLQLARLDPRKVEGVVENGQQRVGALADGLYPLGLICVELGASEQVREPQHRVERRADLVAHHCQELLSGTGRCIGPSGRYLRIFDGLLELGDVGK